MKSGFLKKLFAATLIATSAAWSSFANANFTYDVNFTLGGGSVVGSITTDEALGALTAANILDWNFLLTSSQNNGPTEIYNLFGPLSGGNSVLNYTGSNLLATTTALSFNFIGTVLQFVDSSNASNYLCFGVQTRRPCPPSNTISISTVGGFGTVVDSAPPGPAESTGFSNIATRTETTTVPEPASLGLLGLGLLGLGFAKRKKVSA